MKSLFWQGMQTNWDKPTSKNVGIFTLEGFDRWEMRSEVGWPHVVRLWVIEKWMCSMLLGVLIHHTISIFIGKFIALIYGSKLKSLHKCVMFGVCLTNKELSGIDLNIFCCLFFLFWNTHSCSWRTKILNPILTVAV